jgi:phosphatidylserine/phosphatidylglycerophosphate/cardiolipin synthase-like enzyme
MATLPGLADKYLYMGPEGAPVHLADTEIEPLIDGETYFRAIYDAIKSTTGPGDVIYVLGWRFDAHMDLLRRPATDPNHEPLGQLLAQKAAVGVDVRVVLNGNVRTFQYTFGAINPFADNLRACKALRQWLVPGASDPPLAGRVLFDWAAPLTGSQHQKAVVVKAGPYQVAMVSGFDVWPNRWDNSLHTLLKWHDGSEWGWHDVGVLLRGGAVRSVWANFKSRWEEARTLPPVTYEIVPPLVSVAPPFKWFPPLPLVDLFNRFNPGPLAPPPPDPPLLPTQLDTPHGTQVLRSRFHLKYTFTPFGGRDLPWDGPPEGGIYEVYHTFSKAINNASRFIYIEDQFLANGLAPSLGSSAYSLFPHLRAAVLRGVKIIMVSSGKSDPDDFPSASLKHQQLTSEVKDEILGGLTRDFQCNVAVWRLENLTLHAKVMIIDDVFAAIGSANIQTRSMFGTDSELHVAMVDTSNVVRNFRMTLWAEHLRLPFAPHHPDVEAALANLDTALGIWRSEWQPPSVPGMWREPNNPPGFFPTQSVLSFVGPKLE